MPAFSDRRVRLGLAGGAVVLLIVVTLLVRRGPDEETPSEMMVGRLTKAVTAADRVPKPLPGLPPGCGISGGTLDALVKAADPDSDDCSWYAPERSLVVETDRMPLPGSLAFTSSAHPLYALSPAPPKRLSGLGEAEAFSHYRAEREDGVGEVVFTVRGAAVWVRYRGSAGDRPFSDGKARVGALRAAAEVAAKLGAPAKPVEARGSGAVAPVTRLPKACDIVPAATLAKVANGGLRERGQNPILGIVTGARGEGCTWSVGASTRSRSLQVSWVLVPENAPGGAVATAGQAYLVQHRTARGDLPGEKAAPFRVLAGLGEQAFGGNWGVATQAQARVVFRVRNVLVEVRYGGTEPDPARTIPEDMALNGAYTVALDVAKEIR